MTSFHSIVWMDHHEAHVVMLDPAQPDAQHIHSRSHHKHQGKAEDLGVFFGAIANALQGNREVLLTGPAQARNEFLEWCRKHQAALASSIVDSVTSDHPSDGQLLAMARQYFKKFDAMAADPALM